MVEHAETEIERLVRVANEGRLAVSKLAAHHAGEVEFDAGVYGMWHELTPTDFRTFKMTTFRIKPKPAFEPFYVGISDYHPQSWQVKLEGETLHIGCTKFSAKEVKRVLLNLCRNNYCDEVTEHYRFEARRAGISMHGSVSEARHETLISWVDTDRILAALETAGV